MTKNLQLPNKSPKQKQVLKLFVRDNLHTIEQLQEMERKYLLPIEQAMTVLFLLRIKFLKYQPRISYIQSIL